MSADRLGAERGMPEELVDARAAHGRLVRVELHYVDVNGVAYRARFAYDGARKDLVGVSVAEESRRLITRNGVGSVAAAGFSMETGDFAGATTVLWHTSYISREGAESTDIRYYLLAPDRNGGADGKVVVIATARIDFGRPQMMIGVGSWRRIATEGGSGRQARAEG